MPTLDCYATLEVSFDADFEEVKKSYRRLALLHHPDKNRGAESATEKFKQISEAFETLRDVHKRTLYDRTYTRHTNRPAAGKTSTTGYDPRRTYERQAADQESMRRRQEWSSWIETQNEKIDRVSDKAAGIEAEIAELDKKDKLADERLREIPLWWKFFKPWDWNKPVIEESERTYIEAERLQRNAAIAVKLARLEEVKRQLKGLQDEIVYRRAQEHARLWEEYVKRQAFNQAENERQERVRKAQAEAAQRREADRKAQADAERKQKAEQEKAQKEAKRREREASENRRREEMNAQSWSKQARQAERARMNAEEKKWHEQQEELIDDLEQKFSQKSKQQPKNNKASGDARKGRDPNSCDSNPQSCFHRSYWAKQEGRHLCETCQRVQYRFAFRCPQCDSIACASCMRTLKKLGRSV